MPRTVINRGQYLRPRPKRCLLSLTDDVLVELFNSPALGLADIFRLRRTSRLFYSLTHQPIIWKRMLYNFHLPLPPLPPSYRNSLASLSSFETERMITRAITADANWKSVSPKIFRAWKVPAHDEVCSLKMVPGGQFMVASVHEGNGYAITLFMMDHRVKMVYPVAKCRTRSRPYALQTRYMPYHGSQGITVAYVCREAKHSKDREAGLDPSIYSDDAKDIPFSLRYEMVVLHNDLQSLEVLQDPTCPPGSTAYRERVTLQPSPPFGLVTVIRSHRKFDFIDMDVIDGNACLVFTQDRNVTMKNLETGAISSFTCGPLPEENPAFLENQADPLPYRIRAMRILHSQREILIVRTNSYNKEDPLTLELFTLPRDGRLLGTVSPRSVKRYWERCYFHDVQISSHGLPLADDQSVLASLCPHSEPPPLYIYAVTLEPWGTVCYRLWPERVARDQVRAFVPGIDHDAELAQGLDPEVLAEEEDVHYAMIATPDGPPPALADTTFRYNVLPPHPRDRLRFRHQFAAEVPNQRLHFLAGSVRPLLYGVDPGDRSIAPVLVGLHAYADLYDPPESVVERQRVLWPEDIAHREAASKERAGIALSSAGKTRTGNECIAGLTSQLAEDIPIFNVGLVAIAWDDWTARLCVVSQREPTTVYMFEYAHTPWEDEEGNRCPVAVDEVDREFRAKGSSEGDITISKSES